MTNDLETIKRIAACAGIADCVKIEVDCEGKEFFTIEKKESLGEGFFWSSKNEDFCDFIQELVSWQYNKGYSTASKW